MPPGRPRPVGHTRAWELQESSLGTKFFLGTTPASRFMPLYLQQRAPFPAKPVRRARPCAERRCPGLAKRENASTTPCRNTARGLSGCALPAMPTMHSAVRYLRAAVRKPQCPADSRNAHYSMSLQGPPGENVHACNASTIYRNPGIPYERAIALRGNSRQRPAGCADGAFANIPCSARNAKMPNSNIRNALCKGSQFLRHEYVCHEASHSSSGEMEPIARWLEPVFGGSPFQGRGRPSSVA